MNSITKKEIDNRFMHHLPKADQAERYDKVREACKKVANLINKQCPDSREKSLAITKLEEVMFWANASIARNE